MKSNSLTRLAVAEAALAFFVADEVDAIEIPLLLYGDGNDERCPRSLLTVSVGCMFKSMIPFPDRLHHVTVTVKCYLNKDRYRKENRTAELQ